MTIADNIKRLREQHGLTQAELGEIAGVSDKAVSTWENGTAEPRMGAVQRIAEHFNITKGSIVDDNPNPASAPIYEVAAGQGRISSTPTGTMNIHLRDDQFLATVKGRSMEPTLFDGDTVVIDRQSVPDQDGQIVMVKVDGEENTLKRVQIGENGITLIADNPSVFPTKFYTAEQVKDLPVQIMGVVTKLIRDI